MYKKLFAFVVAFCISTAPISAEMPPQVSDQESYDHGYEDGARAAFAACLAGLGCYLITSAQNVYAIPEFLSELSATSRSTKFGHGTQTLLSAGTTNTYTHVVNPLYKCLHDLPQSQLSIDGNKISAYDCKSMFTYVNPNFYIAAGILCLAGTGYAMIKACKKADSYNRVNDII